MPKKQKKPLYNRPATDPHPSLSLSRSTTACPEKGGPEDNLSVAECLKSLRNEDARRLPLRPPPVATVHPSLRNLLDVPETPQPRPRHDIRTALRLHARRVPGPAAPPSWQLYSTRPAPRIAQRVQSPVPGHRGPGLVYQQRPLPGAKLPELRSLLHMALRAVAEQWDWHLQCDHIHLATLPRHLKEVLLTYVTRYATERSLQSSHSTLRMLFPDIIDANGEDEAHQAFTGDAADVTRLDLGRALGTWLQRTSSLKKELIRPHASQGLIRSDLQAKHESGAQAPIELPESWDDADTPLNQNINHYQLPLSTPLRESPSLRFSNLLHLSLALSRSTVTPVSAASWASLLSITPHLSTLQSLSLGYWPRPTLTPHAAAVSATIKNPVSRSLPRISYGGTDMYTESESSWQEAAGILRTLSRHLYCLSWLDLTGCGTWFGALSWTNEATLDDESGADAPLPATGPDWNGSWRNVEYLGLGVGWAPPIVSSGNGSTYLKASSSNLDSSPGSRRGLDRRFASSTILGELDASIGGRGLIKQDWDVEEERRKYLAKKELETCQAIKAKACEVASHLRILRERAGGKWIEIDVSDEDS
jgi:hypothetical protein